MSFSIDRYQENDLSLVRLQDKATATTISILPAFGALLHGFEIPLNGGRYNIIDHYTSLANLEQDLSSSYKSSKLSPFACRIPEGKYSFDDQHYEFATKFKDGNAIHGLLYNKTFRVVDERTEDNKASLKLRYHYKREDPGYPFDYVCDVQYILHPNRVLQLETTLLNLGGEAIPMVDGWHPYFRLDNTIDQYELQFSSDSMLEFNEQLIPTGKMIFDPSFATGVELGNRSLDNCFLLQVQEGTPCCILHNPANHLTLSFYTNDRYPFLQIYTPPHRKSIAIENLSGAPDSFNNGMGLVRLEPRQSVAFNVWYQLNMG